MKTSATVRKERIETRKDSDSQIPEVVKLSVWHGPRMKADLNFTDTKIKNSTNRLKSHVIC